MSHSLVNGRKKNCLTAEAFTSESYSSLILGLKADLQTVRINLENPSNHPNNIVCLSKVLTDTFLCPWNRSLLFLVEHTMLLKNLLYHP